MARRKISFTAAWCLSMKVKHEELTQKLLLLFKLDAESLYKRIILREAEYLETFALKRTREHFKDIFEHRFKTATMEQLAHCSAETIEAIFQFYNFVEDIYWYLKHTEDMPATVEDELTRKYKILKTNYDTLMLYLNAELSGREE